jgi:hypothetical protein
MYRGSVGLDRQAGRTTSGGHRHCRHVAECGQDVTSSMPQCKAQCKQALHCICIHASTSDGVALLLLVDVARVVAVNAARVSRMR